MSSGDSIAKSLTLGGSDAYEAIKKRRKSPSTSSNRNSNAASGGGGRRTTSNKSSSGESFTLAELKAFNKLPDKVRKASKKKIAAFRAAGFGVFEDASVNTQGKGFKRFVTGSKGLK